MKSSYLIYFVLIVLLFISCKDEQEQLKVIYSDSKKVTESKIDTTSIKIADLPIFIEGTSYLLHPIGDVRVYGGSRSYGSGSSSISFSISNYSRFELTGYLENVRFQHKDSTSFYSLTENRIQIQTVTYPQSFSESSKKQILVYTLTDEDTNRDGKIDSKDIKSLYVSQINGSEFTKLSPDFQEVIDWNIIVAQGKLYFRTIEDINKNGAFDKNDTVHYYFVNLLDKEWVAMEYNPIP
ncbi:MAG: hypothetical protein ACK4UK_07190 [Flavobacterium sp.]